MVQTGNTVRLKNLRVVGIRVRNYKRLEAFDLPAFEGLMLVAGENSQGKSSAAEATAIGLGLKAKTGLKQPVNKNAPEGVGYGVQVMLGNPELAYTIKHWSDPDGKSEGFEVISEDTGQKVSNPQSWMKDVLDGLKNPVDILQMEPVKLRAELIRISGVDVDALDKAIEEAKQAEKQAEQTRNIALGKVNGLAWHEDAPESEQSAAELSAKIQQATADNNTIISQVGGYEASVRSARLLLLPSTCEGLIESISERVADWNEGLKRGLVDLAPLQAQMANIDVANRKYRENQALLEAKRVYDQAEAAVGVAASTRKAQEAAKKKALSEARFPVEGLGFDEKDVTFNGIPFSSAGNAERIRVAVAICLAGRGALPFLLIDNAEAIDNKSLKLLIEEVDRQGAQCLAFSVANVDDEGFHDRACSFAIVNGNLVKPKVRPTEGKGGAGQVPPVATPRSTTGAPEQCPTCGGFACGPFCMNGDGA